MSNKNIILNIMFFLDIFNTLIFIFNEIIIKKYQYIENGIVL